VSEHTGDGTGPTAWRLDTALVAALDGVPTVKVRCPDCGERVATLGGDSVFSFPDGAGKRACDRRSRESSKQRLTVRAVGERSPVLDDAAALHRWAERYPFPMVCRGCGSEWPVMEVLGVARLARRRGKASAKLQPPLATL